MIQEILRLFGVDLQRQIGSLRAQALLLKEQTTADIKHQIASVGLTIGLVFGAVVFGLITAAMALIALYLWVAEHHGAYAGLGVIGGLAAITAAVLLIAATAKRGTSHAPPVPPPVQAVADPAPVPPNTALLDAIASILNNRTAGATQEAFDNTEEALRKAPRNTILLTLAAAAMIGLLIGRQK